MHVTCIRRETGLRRSSSISYSFFLPFAKHGGFCAKSNCQIVQNAIQEIERIAEIVRTNEPSFSSARSEPSSSSTSNASSSSSTSTDGSGDQSTAGQSRTVRPSLSRVCDARNALTELRRRFPTLSSSTRSSSAVVRGESVRRHGNVGRPSRGSVVKDIIMVGAQVEKTPLIQHEKLLLERKNRVITGFAI